MLSFILSFLLALVTGQTYMSEESSISSDNAVPEVTRTIEWQCGAIWNQPDNDPEICFINLDTGEMGP